MRRRLLLGCLAATVVGAGLSAHGHEAPGTGRDREAADAAAPAFVSIDPHRDTPKALREYVENFDVRILPLSGNAEQLARAAASVGVVFYKVPGPTPDEYTFAHNAIVTLVGPEGGIVTRFSSDAVVDDLARALRRLIDPAGS